jgi:heterodisulfide reductase subunit A
MAETSSEERVIGSILVVGAGVAGIRAALDLAEVGYRVLLTDSSPAIGGILAKLDYQFPNDHCGMCKMLPVVGREYASQYCMRKSLFHDNIKIMPFTDVKDIRGEPGAYEIELVQRARHVDTDVCIGTGYCVDVCPIEVPDEFNQGLTRRKAVFQPVPHNLANMYLIDMKACDKCGKCVEVCPVDAIDLDTRDEESTVEVDAIIFAAGTGLYDPSISSDLSSYGVSRDVVTALEFERLLSSTGSYDGQIRRPSDGRAATRIAWLQCVGSRNRKDGRDYCSSICCMFALKEAVLAHEKGGADVETTIFYMDMRTFGKDFYRYREHAEEEYGVRLVRCRVHTVDPLADGTLRVRYLDPTTREWAEDVFDLVVLSTGQNPGAEVRRLAGLLDIEPTNTGYFPSMGVEKVRTPKEGVFMCGSFLGLTDIGEALTSGSAAASEASKLMTSLGKPFKEDVELPSERAVGREPPDVAVLLCRWNNGKMPGGIQLEPLRDALARRSGVGEVHILDTLCRGEGYEQAAAILARSACNRVLFGACLPYVYRQRLKLLAQKAGLNPSLVDVVDIRSTIQRHLAEKDVPTLMRKVEGMVQMALEKLKRAEALELESIPVIQQALVVGGGVAGMRAAVSLAERGVHVHLLERNGELGGRPLKRMRYTLEGVDPKRLVAELQQAVWESKRVTVHKPAEILRSAGSLGNFRTVIRNGEDEEVTILHGATIIATGGGEAATTEYCYGRCDRILTQSEVEDRLAADRLDPGSLESVVMIQCVGSRERGAHEYCSRVCCAAALKNAFKIRDKNPGARILILYRDIMTYGFLEQHYTRARGQGVLFTPYELDDKPRVEVVDDRPVVRFTDPILGREVEVNADLLCLSTGIEAERSNEHLARVFGLELTRDGFFQEAESKWRPVDFLKEGMFLAGTAHSPRPIAEVIAQAEAAAQRAFTYLSRQKVTTARVVSWVHDSLCSRCQTCVTVCPYDARSYDPADDRIVVDQAACQGCGMCAVACPNSASEVRGMSEGQTMAIIDAALQEAWIPAISD